MPDGFTPVSLSLFDAQINLIATRYSLHGTNVLVHCRGQLLVFLRSYFILTRSTHQAVLVERD